MREVMTKLMRGRRDGGNSVGSMASHWLMLMLPVLVGWGGGGEEEGGEVRWGGEEGGEVGEKKRVGRRRGWGGEGEEEGGEERWGGEEGGEVGEKKRVGEEKRVGREIEQKGEKGGGGGGGLRGSDNLRLYTALNAYLHCPHCPHQQTRWSA